MSFSHLGQSIALNDIARFVECSHPDVCSFFSFEKKLNQVEEWATLQLFCEFRGRLKNLGYSAFSVDFLIQYLNITPKFNRQLKALLSLFVSRKCVEDLGDECYRFCFESVSSGRELRKTAEEFLKDTAISSNVLFLQHVLTDYFSVLTRQKSFLPVMFPGGSFSRIKQIYSENPDAFFYNQLVALAVCAYFEKQINPKNNFLKIVEIGAGIGATTTEVLKFLDENQGKVEYCYTDLSKAFFAWAKSNFAPYSFMRYFALDIMQSGETQGIMNGSCDVVIATNVLHATPDVKLTLANALAMLKSGGILILNEGIRRRDFSTLAYGLTDGWWAFEDDLRIKDSPFIDLKTWGLLLDEQRCQLRLSLNELLSMPRYVYQDVLVVEKG